MYTYTHSIFGKLIIILLHFSNKCALLSDRVYFDIIILMISRGSDFMSSVRINVPEMNFTPVSNIFIDKYMCDARGDFVRVYLLCLRLGYLQEETSIERIASSLKLLQADVINAFEYWEERGMMKVSPQGIIEILPDENRKIESKAVTFDRATTEMLDGIEKLIARPLSSKEMDVFMHIIDDFKFTPEMVNILVEYCITRKKTDIRYIEKVAIGWHDSGIKTYEDAQNHITKHEEKWVKYRNVLNYMGFKDSEISKPQEEFLEKWIFKFKLPVDLIKEACRICVMRINEANFSYIDAILSDWNKNNIKSIKDLEKLEKKQKGLRQSPSSSVVYIGDRKYDIDKLEKQLLGRNDIDEK